MYVWYYFMQSLTSKQPVQSNSTMVADEMSIILFSLSIKKMWKNTVFRFYILLCLFAFSGT